MRKLVAFVVLVCLTVYTAIIYNSAALMLLAGAEFFLLLFLFVILLIQTLRLEISVPETTLFFVRGEARELAITANNRCIFPIRRLAIKFACHNQSTGEKQRKWLKQALEPGTNRILLPEWSFGSGLWQLQLKKVRVYDLWRFWSLPGRKAGSLDFVLLPVLHETRILGGIPESEATFESEEYHPHKSGSDSSYTREIREYRPGDSLRSIHWKLSAKKEELLVKEYGLPLGCGMLLGLSCPRLTEEILEITYSLLWGFLQISCNVLLVWKGAKGEPLWTTVLQEEDVYLGMESLMRQRVAEWDSGERPALPARQLWLEEGPILKLDGRLVADFSKNTPEEVLTDMELIL